MTNDEMILAARKYDFFFYKIAWLRENVSREIRKKQKPETKPCGKVIYESRKMANMTANKIEAKRTGKPIKNVYFCKKCQGLHFSKMGKQDLKGE